MNRRDQWEAANEGKRPASAGPLFDVPIVVSKEIPDGVAFVANQPIEYATVNGVPVGGMKPGDVVTIRVEAGAQIPTAEEYHVECDRMDRRTPAPTGFEAGMAASDASARATWDGPDFATVDAAIRALAARGWFTSDDVWRVCPSVPFGKGIGSRLNAAARAGIIRNTGRFAISNRGGKHDHGQRLVVWERA